MPCGGIYPIKESFIEPFHNTSHPCWQCNKGSCDLFCDEWDTPIHSECVDEFLKTDEGKIVLNHGHSVIVVKDGERHVLVEEAQ